MTEEREADAAGQSGRAPVVAGHADHSWGAPVVARHAGQSWRAPVVARHAGHSWRAPVVAGAVAALVLLLRAPLDVGPRDTGELSAAARVLGVAHPTGAPASLVVQSLASYLPLGTVASRQGWAMAMATGVAVACVARAVTDGRTSAARWSAAAVLAAIPLAPTIFLAATMTEMYAVSLALVAASWALLATTRQSDGATSPIGLAGLGALTGLGAAAHVTARLLVPLVSLFALYSRLRAPSSRETGPHGRASRRALACVAPYVAGVATTLPLVLYVPAAASRQPPVNWGNAGSPRMFWRHFMASDIRDTFAGRTSGGHRLDDAVDFGRTTLLDAGIPILTLATAGAIVTVVALLRAGRRTPRRSNALSFPLLVPLSIVAVCAVDASYSFLINPMGIVDRQVGHATLLALAALGAGFVADVTEWRGSIAGACLAVGAVVGISPRVISDLAGNQGRFVPEVWTVPGALARVPARALVVCNGDDLCGGALYAQVVEGARPDVGVVPRTYIERPELLSPRLASVAAALEPAMSRGDRPLLIEASGKGERFPTAVDPAAPLVRMTANARERTWFDVAGRMRALDEEICPAPSEPGAAPRCPLLTRRLLAQAHAGSIGPSIATGHLAEATEIVELALRLDPLSAPLWNDRAVVRATAGRLREALADARHAVELDPSRAAAQANRISYAAMLGELDEAATALAAFRARCHGCLRARLLGAALQALMRDPTAGRQALDGMREEAARAGSVDAWCRAYDLGGLGRPGGCEGA